MDKHKLYYLRTERGYTLEQVAKKVGTTKQHLSRLENNEQVGGVKLLKKLAEFYETTIDYLLAQEVEATKISS